MNPKTVLTNWSKRVYDVWGNPEDGFEVNDSFSDGNYNIRCKIVVNNPNTECEFLSAYPSDWQIGQIFGFSGKLDIDGDDTHIYVNRESDGYPLGELYCESHESLSPIRAYTLVLAQFIGEFYLLNQTV